MIKNIQVIVFLIFIQLLLRYSVSWSQENQREWWIPVYEKGAIQLQQGKLDDAEQRFNEIIRKDKNIAEAYYGLGLVYNQREPGSRQAQLAFNRAIDLKSNFADAYYQLAMVYKGREKQEMKVRELLQNAVGRDPSLTHAWIALAEIQEYFLQYGEMIQAYAKAVETNPTNQNNFNIFFKNAIWFQQIDKAQSLLEVMQKKYPTNGEVLYYLAYIAYLQEDYDKSFAYLTKIEQETPAFSPCRTGLLKAKNLMAQKDSSEWYDIYENSLRTLVSQADENTILEDVCYIMSNEELAELNSTPRYLKGQFYQRFWKSRDPNLASRVNERIPEHYQRLIYARKHFRRFTKTVETMEDFYASEHPYASINLHGTRLLKETYFPRALPELRELDDKGVIFIRHGFPDEKVSSPQGVPSYININIARMEDVFRRRESFPREVIDGGNESVTTMGVLGWQFPSAPADSLRIPRVYMGESLLSPGYFSNLPLNESWKYFARFDRPEIVFHFKKYGGSMGWILEAIPYAVAEREQFGGEYYQLGMESFESMPNPSLVREISETIATQIKKDLTIGMKSETSGYQYTEDPMDFPFQLLGFKFERGNNLIEFYYGIDGSQVQLASAPGENYISLSKFVGIYDEKWNEIRNLKRDDTIPVRLSSDQFYNFAGVDVGRFVVPPGNYHYEIQLKDNTSGKLAVYRGRLETENYNQNTLKLSDIILSGKIKPAVMTSKFQKEDIVYAPHMFTAFFSEDTVGIYFEIYNLVLNDDGESHFRIVSNLKPAKKENSPAVAVGGFFRSLLSDNTTLIATSYDYSGRSRDEKIYLNFELNNQNPDEYEFEIEVSDLNAGTNISQKVMLKVK
jgi:GWxTD domain-containing protein